MKYGERYEPLFIDEQGIMNVYNLDFRHRGYKINEEIERRYVIGMTTNRWNDWTDKGGFQSVFPPYVRVEEWTEVILPFSGFYESIHDDIIDRTLERMFMDEDGDVIQEASDFANGDIDWRKVHVGYAMAYASQLLGDERHTFVKLSSPREYNFSTDKIIVKMPFNALWVMHQNKEVNARFREVCKEMFTSCSGFISFYDPDPTQWGPQVKWDAVQWSAVLKAHADVTIPSTGDFDSECEGHLMGNWTSNGNLDNLLWSSLSNPAQVEALLMTEEEA